MLDLFFTYVVYRATYFLRSFDSWKVLFKFLLIIKILSANVKIQQNF